MSIGELISLILAFLFVLFGAIGLGLLFYIGKTRIKEIDKAVLGYEFPHDSIFVLIIRVPNYASGFMWKWSARRTGLEGKIEHFDSRFRWPFIASSILIMMSALFGITGIILQKFFGIV